MQNESKICYKIYYIFLQTKNIHKKLKNLIHIKIYTNFKINFIHIQKFNTKVHFSKKLNLNKRIRIYPRYCMKGTTSCLPF